MNNPHNLPPHLVDMTQAKWDSLSTVERNSLLDTSHLHPALHGLEGKKVKVTPKREHGPSTFRVGVSTGWRPVHLAMRENARGSSDVINAGEQFAVSTIAN